MKMWFENWNDGNAGPKRWEWILAGVLLFVSAFFFCFQHDFYLTVNHSLLFDDCLFNGKLLNYYSVVKEQALIGAFSPEWEPTLLAGANYSIINYASFGLICLPAYIIGKIANITIPFLVYEVMIKIVYIVLTLYMAKIVYDICGLLKFDRVKAKWVAFLFVTSPVLLFSSTMITHLDIFCVLFFLMGMRSLLKENHKLELIFFMIAVAYKPFVILGIIPIILLKEKRILYIIRDGIVVVLGLLLQSGIYHFDLGYGEVQKVMGETYNFVGRFFAYGIDFTRNFYKGTSARASVFIISFCVLCVLAYCIKKVKNHYLFAFPLAVWCAFTLFVQWHPNWLLLMVPFMIFAVGYSYHKKVLLILEGAFFAFFLAVNSIGWPRNYDNNILTGGVFPQLFGWSAKPKYSLGELLIQRANTIPMELYGSMLCGITVCIGVVVLLDMIKHRKQVPATKEEASWERGAIWFSICPIVVYILYSLVVCFL